jgi:2-polyprenyl-3-methyl-5-hydroxy-6-metoxy-1,4-benzoquinol methylase
LFSERLIQPELLDHADPAEARRNLADLVRINRHFGGHSALRKTLAHVARENETFTLLDIGAASGDTARLIQQIYPLASVTSLDYNLVNLEQAPPPKVIADAFLLPLKAESFDFVLCSSFLHHFRNEQVTELLRSFYAISRRALLAVDLERHVLPYWFIRATQPFYGWGRITVHDGQISVRASFQERELLRLAANAGIENAAVKRFRPAFRLGLVARKD